jgi:hypothetical protein
MGRRPCLQAINLPSPLQCVNTMLVPSHHVELALYADVTSIIATSRKPVLLVGYLESYLKRLRALAVKTEHRHRLEENGDSLYSQVYPQDSSSSNAGGANLIGRHIPLSEGVP